MLENVSQSQRGMARTLIVALPFVILLLCHSQALADIVYGEAAPLTGVRDDSNGELAIEGSEWSDGKIEWEIVDNGDGTFKYTYFLTDFGSGPGISHFTLDISDDAVSGGALADEDAITAVSLNGNSGVTLEFGDKDGITGAVKFDAGEELAGAPDLTYMFTSNRQPVWGHFLAKGGASNEVTNLGFGDNASMATGDYIARPNSVVPEPSAFLLVGLVAVGLVSRRVTSCFSETSEQGSA